MGDYNHSLELTMTSATSTTPNKKKGPIVSRGWMVTINNPVIPGDAYLNQWLQDGNILFGCGQKERAPETGTPHLQLYIYTKENPGNKNGFGVKWMKENIHSTAHLDKRFGTHDEARDYCTLPEYKGKKKVVLAGPWTVGTYSPVETQLAGKHKGGQVNKSNYDALYARVKEGVTDRQLADEFPHLYMTAYKGIEKVRLIFDNEVERNDPYRVVLWGPTGTGKSHMAADICKNNGGGKFIRRGNGGNLWADGYDPRRHPVVVFEEFDGSFMPYRKLLSICDKWPCDLDTKGGVVMFNPKIIIFTAHSHPKDWYHIEKVPDMTELMRRFSGTKGAIIEMKTPFVAEKDATPELKDIISDLVMGHLTKSIETIIKPFEDEEAARAATPIIDLRDDDDDVDDKFPLEGNFEEQESLNEQEFMDMLNCDFCGTNVRDGCNCCNEDDDDPDNCEKYSPPLRPVQRRNAMSSQGPIDSREFHTPPPSQKRNFELIAPPKASAAEFKKYKQIPGQAKLRIASQQL